MSLEVIWRPKGTLRRCEYSELASFAPGLTIMGATSHMDAVRSVALHPTIFSALSGSEDCTAKLWNLQDCEGTKRYGSMPTQRGTKFYVNFVINHKM